MFWTFFSPYQNFYISISPHFTMFSGTLLITSPIWPDSTGKHWNAALLCPRPSDFLWFLLSWFQAWIHSPCSLSLFSATTSSGVTLYLPKAGKLGLNVNPLITVHNSPDSAPPSPGPQNTSTERPLNWPEQTFITSYHTLNVDCFG